jgi:trk system potassium uptake protein
VGSLFVHKYQLLPLMIAALMQINENRFFEILNPQMEFWTVFACSSVFFVFSSLRNYLIHTIMQTAAFFIIVALFLNRSLESPSFGVILVSIFLVFMAGFWRAKRSSQYNVSFRDMLVAIVLSFASFLFYILVSQGNEALLVLGLSLICFSLLHMTFQWLKLHSGIVGLFWSLVFFAVFFAYQFVILDTWLYTGLYLGSVIGVVAMMVKTSEKDMESFLKGLFLRPEIVVFSYFSGLILLGALFLQAPLSSNTGSAHNFIDALFTAASAASLTGLVVLDTGRDFSFIGQCIILLLIQLGALGIVSLSSWAILLFQSKSLGVQYETTIQNMSGIRNRITPGQSLKRILLYFFSFEFCGCFLLFLTFLGTEKTVVEALWKAVFTTISAFCNAGFALNTDSLIAYQSNPFILTVVSILMVTGGFAPIMAIELPSKLWRGQLNLQDKLVVYVTATLLILGFGFYLALEWGHSMAGLSLGDKIFNAMFQGTTVRSGGFNSLDMTQLRDTTVLLFLGLMLIGGNPGGAAGGVKTIPFAVVLLATVCAINGSRGVKVYNRYIPNEIVIKSITIITLWLSAAFIFFFMLSMTQNIPMIPLLFETFSALGTCGLSLGATAELDEVGKFIVSLCMLIGRVGPLGVLILVVSRRREAAYKVPKEEIYVS